MTITSQSPSLTSAPAASNKKSPQAGAGKLPDDAVARLVALELLLTIMDKRTPYMVAISAHSGFAALEPRDRHFVQLLVFTVLRHAATLDAMTQRFMQKPLAERYKVARTILRLGAAQLLYIDTPPHAAVHSSVSLAEHKRCGPVKGMINAVLRRVSEYKATGESWEEISFLPDWMQESWKAAYGEETATRMMEGCRHEAPLDITVKSDPDGWASKLGGHIVGGNTLRLQGFDTVQTLSGFDGGEWWVQDVASALPISLLGDLQGKRVLDLCAAPGGKTLQLASAGAQVTAIDKAANRIKQLHENLTRTGLKADVVEGDVMRHAADEPYDLVVLDAPCSATGTLRRHPDIAYTKQPRDVAALAALQRQMLEHALTFVKPGGRLLYCTCSLQPDEGEIQAAEFVSRHEGAVAISPFDADTLVAEMQHCVTAQGTLRTLPSYYAKAGGMDGFFAACFTRLR